MKPTIRSIRLGDGLVLPYAEQGDPAGLPVIFLHGVTDSWRSFEPVLPHLPPSIHAFALTQRGHGDAGRPATGYRTRDFARDVAAFMDAAGLGQAVLVGHSMGTTNALRFAIDHPERTLGLVLAGAFASYRRNAGLVHFAETIVSTLTDPIDPVIARDFQQSTLAQAIPTPFFDMVVHESRKVPAHVWRGAFAGFMEDDFTGELGEVGAPTLIIWGTGDEFCPRADQHALLDAIPGARLTIYEQAGHALHWEEPARFAAEVTAFVEGVVAPPQRSGRRRQPGSGSESALGVRSM